MKKHCLLLLCCLWAALAARSQPTPRQIAQKVADKIVSLTPLRIDTVPVNEPQERTYLLNFGKMHMQGKRPGRYLAQSAIWREAPTTAAQISLLISHSPGKIQITYTPKNGKPQVFTHSSIRPFQVDRRDYELIRFQHRIDVTVPANGDPGELSLALEPSGPDARVLLALADPTHETILLNAKLTADPASVRPFRQSGWLAPDEAPVWVAPPAAQRLALSGDPMVYSDWRYFTGVFNNALLDVRGIFPDLDYRPFVRRHVDFFYQHKNRVATERARLTLRDGVFNQYFRFTMLDDFGPQGAVLWRLWRETSLQEKKWSLPKAARRDAQRIAAAVQKTVPRYNGAFARLTPKTYTVQSDDALMGGYFLVKMAQATGQKQWLDKAVTQSLAFHNMLFQPENQLYYHAAFSPQPGGTLERSCCQWARGMGWVMIFNAELLRALPVDHPSRSAILSHFQQTCAGLLRVQTADGRWHQVLTDPSTYLETSATAMFVAAFAEGVAQNWLPAEPYRAAARKGWDGLCQQIDADGNVADIVVGTPILESAEAYNAQKTRLNDPRGMGAVLWAAMAMERMGRL